MTARGVDLDITETGPIYADDTLNVICPSDVRINGYPVLVPNDTAIDIASGLDDIVTVRISLVVGRLNIRRADDTPEDDTDPPIWADLAAWQRVDPRTALLEMAAMSRIGAAQLGMLRNELIQLAQA